MHLPTSCLQSIVAIHLSKQYLLQFDYIVLQVQLRGSPRLAHVDALELTVLLLLLLFSGDGNGNGLKANDNKE